MNLKRGLEITTFDFWYDLMEGGYLKPDEMLEREEDIKEVKDAMLVLDEFYGSCKNQIRGFIQ